MCFVTSMVQIDWTNACIVRLYKGKDNKYECASYRSINVLSVLDKVYGKVLIKRIKRGIECVII